MRLAIRILIAVVGVVALPGIYFIGGIGLLFVNIHYGYFESWLSYALLILIIVCSFSSVAGIVNLFFPKRALVFMALPSVFLVVALLLWLIIGPLFQKQKDGGDKKDLRYEILNEEPEDLNKYSKFPYTEEAFVEMMRLLTSPQSELITLQVTEALRTWKRSPCDFQYIDNRMDWGEKTKWCEQICALTNQVNPRIRENAREILLSESSKIVDSALHFTKCRDIKK